MKTYFMCKPDSIERKIVGKILSKVEGSGLDIVRMEMYTLTPERAREFYKEHEGKPFLDELVAYMTRGPVVGCVIEGESAVTRMRELMGATNPTDAAEGTIRKEFGVDIGTNTVHGSDSPESAAREVGFFFPDEAV